MIEQRRERASSMTSALVRIVLLATVFMIVLASGRRNDPSAHPDGESNPSTGSASIEGSAEGISINELFFNPCMMEPEEQQDMPVAPSQAAKPNWLGGDVPPIRSIIDPYPSFNGVSVDPESNLVFLSDSNRKSLLVYDRASGNSLPEMTMPLRRITGPTTLIGFVCGVTYDVRAKEVFAINNDIEDTLMVFSYEDNGNPKPKRVLSVPHGAWGISMSKARNEFSLSIQDGSNNAVVTYNHDAKGFDAPVRVLQGRETELADPHGIFVDDKNNELIATNWGSWNLPLGRYTSSVREQIDLPGGKFLEPSITVYEATAQGNAKPLRKIQGPATQLSWPTGIDVDLVNDEIIVANNMGDSILFFHRTDGGNAKPFKIIKGNRTGIRRPMGVSIDRKNNEVWVANFGDHTSAVFELKASGNVAPKRVVRNAPKGTPSAGFGHPMTLSYDSKRAEILVPN
jgi:DNA-binding beta-propeller fold protein YncE